MSAPAHLSANQSGVLQRLDMLRGRRQRNLEGLGELADRPLPAGECVKHAPARRIAQGVKDGIQLGRLKFNHGVECKRSDTESQPFG